MPATRSLTEIALPVDPTSALYAATKQYVDDNAGGGSAAYAETFGNGSATSYTITHNLNTRDVVVSVYEVASPYVEHIVRIEHATLNTVTIVFSVAPATNSLRAVVCGGASSSGSSASGADDPATYATVNGADEGYDAEFTGASLPAGWSTLNGGTSVVTVANGLAVLNPEGDGDFDVRVVARTVPVETNWIVEAKLIASGQGFSGLVVLDDSGADVLTQGWYHNSAQLVSERRSYTGWVGEGPASWNYTNFGDRPTYWRMHWNAGDVLMSVSNDGWNWTTPQLSTPYDADAHVVSPSHVGFFGAKLTTADIRVACEWFRVRTP